MSSFHCMEFQCNFILFLCKSNKLFMREYFSQGAMWNVIIQFSHSIRRTDSGAAFDRNLGGNSTCMRSVFLHVAGCVPSFSLYGMMACLNVLTGWEKGRNFGMVVVIMGHRSVVHDKCWIDLVFVDLLVDSVKKFIYG